MDGLVDHGQQYAVAYETAQHLVSSRACSHRTNTRRNNEPRHIRGRTHRLPTCLCEPSRLVHGLLRRLKRPDELDELQQGHRVEPVQPDDSVSCGSRMPSYARQRDAGGVAGEDGVGSSGRSQGGADGVFRFGVFGYGLS